MNILTLLAIVFALFIAVDIFSAKLLKVSRTTLRNISLVALCVLTLASGIGGGLLAAKNANTTTKLLYNAYSYLLAGNIDKATENAQKVENPHADMISLLGDCWRNNYASAFINADDLKASGTLNDGLAEQADKIYTLARQMTGLEGLPLPDDEAHGRLNTIAEDCFSLLKISEKNEVEFLSGFKRDSMLSSSHYYEADTGALLDMLLETPNDTELLVYSVKYFNAMGDLDAAEQHARQLLDLDNSVENIVLYTDVIAQKLLGDIAITTYDENDSEIAALLAKAENAETAAANYEEGHPRREENLSKASEYRRQANGVKAKRIINWLTVRTPLFGDRSGVITLQLSKLYAAAGEEDKARELLLDLLAHRDDLSDDSSIKAALEQLGGVYYDAAASDEDIAAAIDTILRSDAFLPESVLNRGYSQFLGNFLKYERASIFISRVNAENYPTVRAYLNVNGKRDGIEELANDFTVKDFTFTDNGFEISPDTVTRITDDSSNYISIALVIDGSGSMAGTPIQNARQAVEACINNLEPETQELSIILYGSDAAVLSPLTNDVEKLRAGAGGIVADGGTNIPVGLLGGIASLQDAIGTKAIILMTDGQDGNASQMPAAIEAAKAENIAVFTVSTGGGNREYMENIATETGGSYMEAMTDAELVSVYTALQNYIVNNYCFEYTVKEDSAANPRQLTIGLADYHVSSSRTYSYGDLVLARDGSYIVRAESEALRLRYAQPSVVSTTDAELGVPIFISADGVTDGATVLVNGSEMKDVKTVDNTAITFTLQGAYTPGKVNITVRLPDGSSKSTDTLLSVSDVVTENVAGQTISLGRNGSTLYADRVEQLDEFTLKLSGNVILNGFIRTSSAVTVYSYAPVSMSAGRMTLLNGSIEGSGAGYADFTAAGSEPPNYGQLAFGGESVKVLDVFSFTFDEYSIELNSYGATLNLPGFGEVYGDAQFSGTELTYTVGSGYMLSDLQDNLNYALNSIPLPQSSVADAVQMITGYTAQDPYGGYNSSGLYAQTEDLTITIRKNFVGVVGAGTVGGYLGLMEIADGQVAIDTANTASMFSLTGTAKLDTLLRSVNITGDAPITITSAKWYPESITLNATGFSIHSTALSECFTGSKPPKALEGTLTVKYPLAAENEPYGEQVSPLLSDILLTCDRIAFICTSNFAENGVKVYSDADPTMYVKFTSSGMEIPLHDVDELSLFGTDIGGEILGTATINDWQIHLSLDIDGHLDNSFLGVKHDGKANLSVQLPRNSSAINTFEVVLTYGGKTLSYNASASGSIIPPDGFHTYAEDYAQ